MIDKTILMVTVETASIGNGRISQTITSEVNGLKQKLMQAVFNTKEEQLRDVLVKLGWTHPKGE